MKWQNLFKGKGSGKIGGGLCFEKHSHYNSVSVLGESIQFNLTPQDGIIIKNGSDEAKQISAGIEGLLFACHNIM